VPLFFLDADVFSAIARQTSASAERRFAELPSGSVALSVITCAEIAFGMEKRRVGTALATRIARLQQILPLVALHAGVVSHYARTRTHLERQGTPIGTNDLWLSSHALSEDLTVVTGNTREFARVPGLRVENWLR
jgi:tRNA(fMet)-specific endonuclease VapC